LTVQVGAHDNQTINVGLKEITASTLGLGGFNAAVSLSSKNVGEVVEKGSSIATFSTVEFENTYNPAPGTPAAEAEGVYRLKTPTPANPGSAAVTFKGAVAALA